MREQLLKRGIIEEKEISVEEISNYEKCRLFNALINWSGMKEVEIKDILL